MKRPEIPDERYGRCELCARAGRNAFRFRLFPARGGAGFTVKAGERVMWTNNDGAAHTVTFKDGSASSKSLSPGDAFTRAFDRAGTYAYACSFHPYMTGTVIVQGK